MVPNLRILIPILAIALGVLFVVAIPIVTRDKQAQTSSPALDQQQPEGAEGLEPATESTTATTTTTPASETAPRWDVAAPTEPGEPETAVGRLRAVAADAKDHGVIGSLEKDDGFRTEVTTRDFGAAIDKIRLTDFTTAALSDTPFTIQQVLEGDVDTRNQDVRLPFAVRTLTVGGQRVFLEGVRWRLLEGGSREGDVHANATYEIDIVDVENNDKAVLTFRRAFSVEKDSYEIRIRQRLTNHTDGALRISVEQSSHVDLPAERTPYMGDRRTLMAGYFNRDYDPKRIHIYTDKTNLSRADVFEALPAGGADAPFWPNRELDADVELAWIAAVSRYFTVTIHPLVEAAPKGAIPSLEQVFERADYRVYGFDPATTGSRDDRRKILGSLYSHDLVIGSFQSASLDIAVYAGPRQRDQFKREPMRTFHFGDQLIVYSLGGMCTFCTFQWLARLLLAFLTGIHFVLGDWGLAIIVLVLFVRLLLHPITKKSQIQIAKFQKQMAAMQPEIEKLKKKYGDNQQKIQQEQMKLFREKGINPMNMLGCLPMFLQTPIWIALYAMLFLAIELRHQPAFYGIFQWLGNVFTGTPWSFLADLSESDRFIVFAEGGQRLFGFVYFPYALNVLPILMAVFFYFQTKLTAAPPANDQAKQQQRIMSIMMTTLFPIMLYPAPSGLTLYIMASSLAGMIDSLVVRRHIKKMETDGTLFAAKQKKKEGGFIERISKAVEYRQNQLTGANPSRAGRKK